MGYFKGQGYMVTAFCGTTMHIIFPCDLFRHHDRKDGAHRGCSLFRSRLDTLRDIPDDQFYPDPDR